MVRKGVFRQEVHLSSLLKRGWVGRGGKGGMLLGGSDQGVRGTVRKRVFRKEVCLSSGLRKGWEGRGGKVWRGEGGRLLDGSNQGGSLRFRAGEKGRAPQGLLRRPGSLRLRIRGKGRFSQWLLRGLEGFRVEDRVGVGALSRAE